MYSLDGPPRITHVWLYSGHDARLVIRRASYAEGVWSPAVAPEQIAEAVSTIAVPVGWSPLR